VVVRPHDDLTHLILDKSFPLLFPHLNFLPTPQYTNPDRTQQIMRRIAVRVHASIKDRRRILSYPAFYQGFTTGVLGNEIRHVVNDACNRYKRGFTGSTAGLELVPGEDRKLGEGKTPVEGGTAGIKGFLLLLETAFFDLVVAEPFEVVCEGGFGEEVDEPFCGVVLVPCDGVA
jgi:hypothetical protein